MNSAMRLALLLGLVGCVNAACPSNFIASITIPGKCYRFTTTKNNFFSAVSYCRNLTHGADILSIANGLENSEVLNLVHSCGIGSAWIGNAFYDNKSHWIATSAGSSSYSNWGSGTYNGNVAVIATGGSWSSTNAGNNFGVTCQIYPDDPTTFPPPQITCPDGWAPSISVRGKCYRYTYWTDFFSATRQCLTTRIEDSRAELVTLTSQFEMMELDAMGFGGAWASLTSWEADGSWHWVETLHSTDYFGPYGPPSNSGGTCASSDGGNLYGTPCWYSGAAFCQYFPNEPPAPTPSGLSCPQNGIASLTKPGTCYYVLSQTQSFQSARSACQALNTGLGHNDLFVPRTAAEYEEFEWITVGHASYPLFWFGLINFNGNWGWISDRSSNITNIWCSGQPDNSNGQCGFVLGTNHHDGKICWMAGDCTDAYVAVCQSSNTF